MPGLSWVKLAGLAALLLAVWLGYRWFAGVVEENATLKTSNAVLQGVADAATAAREAIEAERAKTDQIVAGAIASGLQRASQNAPVRREIAAAPVASQPLAACAPATSLVVGRLQQRTGGGEGGNHPVAPAGKPASVFPAARP